MKQYILYLFPIAILAIMALAVIYLSHRFSFYYGMEKARPFYFIFSGSLLFVMVSLLAFTNTTSQAMSLLYMLGGLLAGMMIYLLLMTSIVDLAGIFTSLQPKTYAYAIIFLTVSITGYGILNAWNVRSTHHNIEVENLAQDIRIAHLSDIHIGHFRGEKWMQKIVDETKAQNPDIVCITGDLFDGKIRLNMDIIKPLKQFNIPVYFVDGNHDGYTDVETIKKSLAQNGIRVLSNEVELYKGLQIVGLNHMLADENTIDMHATNQDVTIKSTLTALPISTEQPAILLHHSPDGVQYAQQAGIDLYLAGHTHAGQIFPINFIANWMFAYNRGLHDYKDTKMLVSEGLGTFGPPLRVGTKSEVVVIDLKGK